MLYLDTSLVIAALTPEEATERVQAWLQANAAEAIFASEWVATEVSSALSLKVRTGQIALGHRPLIASEFNRMLEGLRMADIDAEHFRNAARFVDNHSLGLRAGDALHFAIAFDHGLTLCTLDRRMHQAGDPLGVATNLV